LFCVLPPKARASARPRQAQERELGRELMRHFVIVAILIAVLTPLIYFGLDASHVMPIEASAQAIPVDWMWNMDMGAISFLFALVMVPLIYALIVFRRRKG
jgi:hypothetical protein